MTIQECYAAIGGNYQDVKNRLMKEELVERFVRKFLEDESYEQLSKAIEEEDFEAAFRAVHTLKGICQNLSFDTLSHSASCLTETLRNWESEPVNMALMQEGYAKVKADYTMLVHTIALLETI